jgi:hypothetical protein
MKLIKALALSTNEANQGHSIISAFSMPLTVLALLNAIVNVDGAKVALNVLMRRVGQVVVAQDLVN